MRLIIIAVAWALGISLARALPTIETLTWIATLTLAALCALALRKNALRNLPLILLVVAAGAARQSLVPRSSEIAAFNGFTGTITGIVSAEPVLRDDRVQIRLDVKSVFVNNETLSSSGLVLVEAYGSEDIAYGDRVRATGALDPPGAGDAFSYADYLGRQGVFTIMRNAGLEVIGEGAGTPLMVPLLELKQIVRGVIESGLPEPQAGLLTGILLGDERGISPELEAAFDRVGASHVIAISGFNMVIVSAIVLRMFSSAAGERNSVASICAILVVAMYSLFVGASPGILRAALMSGLLIIGNQLRRRTFLPTSLACAALALSFLDPNVLLDIGFQLSFFAVLGLGLFVDPLSARFEALLESALPSQIAKPIHSFLNEPLIVSFAVQITTLPLTILYFGRLSLVSLPVNLLIVPMQSALLILGFVAVAAYIFMPVIGALFFWAELVCLSWTIAVVRAFAQFEFAEVLVDLDGRLIQLYYLLLIGFAMIHAARPPIWRRLEAFVRRHRVALVASGFGLLSLILIWAMALSRPDGQLHLWFLDVGHSNAVLMQTPAGAHVLIDGGRYPTRLLTAIGDRLPYYDREIEILVISHPDEWDIAALNTLLQRYEIGAWLYHGQINRGDVFTAIQDRLKQSDAEAVEARAGHTVTFNDGAMIEVLHPPAAPMISDRLGDGVITLRVTYGDVSFLLTSDLSDAAQRAMLERGISPVATVMQIPQHGSARALNDEFLEQVQPQVVVLQSDVANRRGDPDPDTLAKFKGLPLFRTDEGGTVHIWTDGATLHINRQAANDTRE